jgi:hypothetical protein
MVRVAPSLRGHSEVDLLRFVRDGRAYLDGDTIVPMVSGGASKLLLNNAETAGSGTTIATNNTGGTDANAFDAVVIGASMTATFDNAHPGHGSNAFKIAQTSTTTAATYVEWQPTSFGGAVARLSGAFYWYYVATIASSIRLINFRNGAASAGCLGCTNGTQGMQWRNAADSSVGAVSNFNAASTLYRVEFSIWFHPTQGEATVNVFLGNSVTPSVTTTVGNVVFGEKCDGVRIGCTTANFSSTSGDAFWIDDLNFNDTGVPAGPGPYSVPVADDPGVRPDYRQFPKPLLQRSVA